MRRGELPAMLSFPLLVVIIGILSAFLLPRLFQLIHSREDVDVGHHFYDGTDSELDTTVINIVADDTSFAICFPIVTTDSYFRDGFFADGGTLYFRFHDSTGAKFTIVVYRSMDAIFTKDHVYLGGHPDRDIRISDDDVEDPIALGLQPELVRRLEQVWRERLAARKARQ